MQEFFLSTIAIFVALDIIGTLPMFVGMTSGMALRDRNRVLDISMVVAFGVAVVFAIAGLKLFGALGITLPDFRIAGGIVLLLISLADLVHQSEAATRASGQTGVVPLAVPLITGPAVLTTLVLQINQFGYPVTLAALAVNYLLAWVLLRKSDLVTRTIGKDGTVVVSKLAALLLAAIAVSMIRSGVFDAIQQFRQG